ncbi:DNA polymerase III subunit beta [bacterium (Candidatus Gribaldobacteria) CG_4_9_14_3_um_filter_36_15]|uniref:Beta sliding clamp n=3 Tax=Candidatus Gribaldobacteria TaxID=2798536 RepID=A0A2H0UWG7_9BACT|nr:MAG: DNA polymerase III subunit beta [Parcubacteria group bacterium CG2_30_36_21]PIR91153.1 MAG: DNA polymerase III subunit beta [bacterium (Candidatus Gribaldobacteria) CG10_big_fil_rev_8_21_14_0_10_37_46]PIV14235.1 MAG: DNA polymerase III subunit beta [bacterium (Candidatus Gribaldobacteria) CG03_land_8_20_14_0_80_36_40]PJB09325.1 MAG: DNA polymerase III subunit beta [bacterium (Candidatus Gribaldobacteria) CG_4_9_14_3_um_filter_36_15]
MKIEILKDNLKRGLEIVEKIAKKNLTLPVLSNVLLSCEGNFLRLDTTNLETSISWWVLAKIEEGGKIAIPAAFFSSLINLLKEERIHLRSQGKNLILETKNQTTQIQGIDPEEFPIIPKIEKEEIVRISNQKLLEALGQIIEIPSISQIRPEISGIYFSFKKDLLKIVGTDSFRLAEKTIGLKGKIKKEVSFILPQDAVRELINILSREEGYVVIYFSPNQILFENIKEETSHTQVQILSRLIEGEYPKYQEIIPKKYKTQIISKKDDLQNQLKQAGLFSGKISEVKLAVQPEDNRLKIYSESPEIGKNEAYLPVKIKGEAIEISFNYKFLILGLQNIRSSEVIFELNGEEGPGVLKPVGDESYIYISMPIKLS